MTREPLLDESFSPSAYPSEPAPAQPAEVTQVQRRQFLQTLGLAGVAITLSPKILVARDNMVARWRDRVTKFVYTICDDRRAQAITARLDRATIYSASHPNGFHYYWAAPLVFVGTTIDPEEVICGNGFEVNRLPFYDLRCPCGGITDLNAFEIRRVSNAREINDYGCVLAPVGSREGLQYADHADYRQTLSRYGYDPGQFTVDYKRVYKGKGRAYRGYQITHKTQVGENRQPLKDMLLSSENV